MVLRALVEPWYEDGFSERVLQMYLNECRMDKGREWYQQTQQAFMAHCSSWEPTFESILRDRQTYGSRRQRSNTMGDWMALSHLQGRPLSMDLLFVTKERHPRDPRPAVITQVPMVSDNTYKYAFETLYLSCYTHDTRWDGWLQKMDLRMMTPALFDVVALRWPDSMPDLVRRTKGDADALLDQWDLILSDLFTAEHGNHTMHASAAPSQQQPGSFLAARHQWLAMTIQHKYRHFALFLKNAVFPAVNPYGSCYRYLSASIPSTML